MKSIAVRGPFVGMALTLFLAACASERAPDLAGRGVWHIVRPGETVYRIGSAYGATAESVIRFNRIRDVRGLQVGTRLWIPGGRPSAEKSWAHRDALSDPASKARTSGQARSTSPLKKTTRSRASITAQRTGSSVERTTSTSIPTAARVKTWLATAARFESEVRRSLVSLAAAWWDAGRHTTARAPVRSLLEIRRENVVVQEFDLSCGAAALATILHYQHGDPVGEREVALALMGRQDYLDNPFVVRARHGFSLLDLKRYVEQRGYRGAGFGRLDLDALVERAPVMVPVNLYGYSHFVVFRGVLGDRVLLADPAWGNRTMRVERFEEVWIDYPTFGRVGFAVERRDETSPPGQLALRRREFVM